MMTTLPADLNINANGSQVCVSSRPQHTWNSGGIHPFTGGPCGSRIKEVPHVNKDSTPIIIFLLLIMEVIQLLMRETNKLTEHHTFFDLVTRWR
jgi:hypothetical protein